MSKNQKINYGVLIGLAGLFISISGPAFAWAMKKEAQDSRYHEKVDSNEKTLEKMLDYVVENKESITKILIKMKIDTTSSIDLKRERENNRGSFTLLDSNFKTNNR